MLQVVRESESRIGSSSTLKFEGRDHGSGVSLFVIRSADVTGPALHQHEYSETFVVITGRVRVTAGGETADAGPGDIVVVEPNTPHTFEKLGDGELTTVHIHASDHMITKWL